METQFYYLIMVISAFSIFLMVFMWLQISYLRGPNTGEEAARGGSRAASSTKAVS